jgi:pilus assembly protein CpaB
LSVHPLRLLALLLLAACVAVGAYQILKPHTVAYIQLRESVKKESGQLLEAHDVEPLILTMGSNFFQKATPVPGLIPWEAVPDLIGLSLTRPVIGGRPLLESDLEKRGHTQTETELMASMTGMSIPVDNVAGVSPYVSTGERVHVYASFEDEVGAHSGLLLENMPIIGVQREMEGEHPSLVAVTLALTRNEAVLLTHALHYGKIRLGLAAAIDGQKAGIGDAKFAADLMKTKRRWDNQEEERE